jgi:hypothetical protein
MTRRPVPNGPELLKELAGRAEGRHWARGRCWCEAFHAGQEAPPCLVAPPWDESRDAETAVARAYLGEARNG